MTVQDIMTSSPAACTLRSNLAEAARIMWSHRARQAPVTKAASA